MSNEQFYQDLTSRHRLFYANWHRFVQLEGAWLHTFCGITTTRSSLSRSSS